MIKTPTDRTPRRKSHRRRVTDEQLLELIREHHGNLAAIVRAMGHRSRTWVTTRIRDNPVLYAAANEARETLIDDVETALLQNVLGGNVQAQIFWLRTQGRSRGWQEKPEYAITGPEGGPLRVRGELLGVTDAELYGRLAILVSQASALLPEELQPVVIEGEIGEDLSGVTSRAEESHPTRES